MKQTGLFLKTIVFGLLTVGSFSPAHSSETVHGGATTAISSDKAEDARGAVNEVDKAWAIDLNNSCKDCTYSEDTHKTTCTYKDVAPAKRVHHLTRCEVILWSENTASKRNFANCDEYFVNKQGHMSSGGAAIIKEIVKTIVDDDYDERSAFLNNNDCLAKQPVAGLGMMPVCPNFNKFDDVKRIQFYEYLMENIAYREVSCANKAPTVRGTNGAAVCAFQLEGNEKIRDSRGLPNCSVSNSALKTSDGCAKCATDIMHHSLELSKNPDHTVCAPFGKFVDGELHKMYWQSLNPPNTHQSNIQRKVLNDLHWFPGCQDNPQPWPRAPAAVHTKKSKKHKK